MSGAAVDGAGERGALAVSGAEIMYSTGSSIR